MADENKTLTEEELENVTGGAVDWRIFSDKFLSYFIAKKIEPTDDVVSLVTAIRQRDYVTVETLAIPLSMVNRDVMKMVVESNV